MLSRPSIPQTAPPRAPKETLPTMSALPSEAPQELGLPNEVHDFQSPLLRETFRLTDYVPEQVFNV